MARNLVLLGALALIGAARVPDLSSVARDGVTGLAVVSLGILAVLGFGVIGALTQQAR